ncbi:unnamed protein product [Diabrotica balteata]|uniref:Endonuclease-reverse transcriptase n=1 Tax=Diabrotica balteata TaxID=107213 RepID=A0A9N9SU29_DIABA|nr:unnamed protein product [Diabrotica balteata]
MKQRTEKLLLATEMDFWRRAAGKLKKDRIPNEIIREMMGVKHTIVDDIKTQQLIWYGHVQRMPDDRIPKQIFTWTPQGRMKRERQRRSWREGIKKELEEREILPGLWLNREEWWLGVRRRGRTL